VSTGRKQQRRKIGLIILLVSLGNFILHMAVSGNWELHRDAYLYLNYAAHPAWGYISVPPFIMVISTIAVKFLGGSAFVVRLFPALAVAVGTAYVGVITKDLGGKRWAVLIATLTYALSPAFLRMGSLFQPVAFNQLYWLMFFYFFVQMLRTRNLNYWYLIALISGIGMLNKYTMLIPMTTAVLGLLVGRRFRTLFCRQFWIGLAGIVLMVAPNIIWQHNHSWPLFYHLNELSTKQLVNFGPIHFTNMQFLMNAHGIFIWLFGFLSFFLYKPFKPYRPIGYAFMFMWLSLALIGAKPYYMLGVYPILFVFGSLIVEIKTTKAEWLRPLSASVLSLVALLLLPLSLPFFKVERMIGYGKILKNIGVVSPYMWEDGSYHELPQDFADMRGWEAFANLAKEAYNGLTEEEKSRVVVFGNSYGKVGAYNYYNRKKSLPDGYSFEGSYMFWAPESIPHNCVMLFLDKPSEELASKFESVEKVKTLNVEFARENGSDIYVLKNPIDTFDEDYQDYRIETLQPFYRKPL